VKKVPLKDVKEEAERILREAERRKISLKLLGGLAIWYTCPSVKERPLSRDYGDIDVIGFSKQSREISALFKDLGYKPRERFNALYGFKRLIFNDLENMRRVDVFLDRFEMAHKFDFKDRINLCRNTLPVTDLLFTKLQIVKINEKDLKDIVAIFLDHEFGKEPCENIEPDYITRLTSEDWGVYRTFTGNLKKVLDYVSSLSLSEDKKENVKKKVESLLSEIEKKPKSMGWKLRAKVGESRKWYEDVEEDQKVVE